MGASVYREFVFNAPSVWTAFVAFVKGNAGALLDQGNPLRVIVTTEERKRNSDQNRYYWKAVMQQIEAQAWVGGQQFSKEVWHEHYARKFGVIEEMRLPSGELVMRRKSTTEMSVREFSEYIERVRADAAAELGVEFST